MDQPQASITAAVSASPEIPKAPELTPEQVFIQGYQKLCQETGLVYKVEPKFKLRDDNTFSLVLEMSIAPVK